MFATFAADAVVLGRQTGLLDGAAGVVVAAVLVLLVPTSRELPRRVLLAGCLLLGWSQVLWWWPLAVGEPGRVTLGLAVLAGALAAWIGGAEHPGGRARRLWPRLRPADLALGLPVGIGIACTGPWLEAKTPTQTLGMLMGGWDNVAHFSMVHMIRRFGATVDALPPPTPGTTWQFAGYPQGFHAVAAGVVELLIGPADTGLGPELTAYTRAMALVVIAVTTTVVAGFCALPAVRRRPVLACPVAAFGSAVFLLGPGAQAIGGGIVNFAVACGLAVAVVLLAVTTARVVSPLTLAAIGGAVVGVATSWVLLLALAGPALLVLVLPLRRRRWAASRARVALSLGVAVAVVAALAHTAGVLSRIQAANPLTIDGGRVHVDIGLVVAAGLAIVGMGVALVRRHPRVAGLMAMPVAAAAVTTGLVALQVAANGEITYYGLKFLLGTQIVLFAVLPVPVVHLLDGRSAPDEGRRRARVRARRAGADAGLRLHADGPAPDRDRRRGAGDHDRRRAGAGDRRAARGRRPRGPDRPSGRAAARFLGRHPGRPAGQPDPRRAVVPRHHRHLDAPGQRGGLEHRAERARAGGCGRCAHLAEPSGRGGRRAQRGRRRGPPRRRARPGAADIRTVTPERRRGPVAVLAAGVVAVARRARPPRSRGSVAVLAAVVGVAVVALSLGLLGTPVGAGDNGDGVRLYCGAGLVPLTPDGRSNWQGGVVLDFATGAPACPDAIASTALPMLRLATVGSGPTWSLVRLGLLYALAVGMVTGLAAWAVRPGVRLLALVPPLVPLVGPTFTRFFVSTFSEPAGLLGAYALCLGTAVVAVTGRAERSARAVGLALVAGGGLVAATAKASFLPLLAVALVVAAATAVGRRRWVGLATAGALALVATLPVVAVVQWQQRHFAAVNAHNLVYTAVLPDVGAAALGPLGLPPAALAAAGRAYYPAGVRGVPGAEVVAADPAGARVAAYEVLLAHPGAAVRALGRGLTATLGADLSYLPSAPVNAASVPPVLGTTVGPQGADRAQLLAWLDGLPVPWLPALVAAAGMLAGLLTVRLPGAVPGVVRPGELLVRDAGRVAALAAVSAVGLVATAVLGDGYFEIAKHTWLGAYLLAVAAAAVLLAAVGALAGRIRQVVCRGSQPMEFRSRWLRPGSHLHY